MDELGTLLRPLRVRAGLTQEELAARSGVSISTIRRLETGKSRDHRLSTLNLLADALDVGPGDRRRLTAGLTKAGGGDAAGIPVDSETATDAKTPVPAGTSVHVEPPGVRPQVREEIIAAADALGNEVRRRWRQEVEQRRIHDPFPLPVRWHPAPPALTDRPETVQRLPPGAPPRPMDLTSREGSVAEVYRRIPSGRLVILGRAGSGKSVLTGRFVLDHLAARTPADRVPVVFSVGSWDPTAVALRDWLVDRLVRDHPHLTASAPGGSNLAVALIDADLILPVLDGFDEIAEGLRRVALETLNTTSMPLILTSRQAEFTEAVQDVGAPLVWAAGIRLAELTLDDLAAYLPLTARPAARRTGPGEEPVGGGRTEDGSVWDGVLAELLAYWDAHRDPAQVPLAVVLRTPLMISLARTMYSEASRRNPAELLDTERFPDVSALEEHLLAGFVPSVYRRPVAERAPGRRSPGQGPAPEHAERWLGYLAHHLARLGREQQDLAWWQIGASLPLATRILTVVAASALCVFVPELLVCLVLLPQALGETLLLAGLTGPITGLAFGCVFCVVTAFGREPFEPARARLRLPGTARRPGRGTGRTFAARFGTSLLGGFLVGPGCACTLTLDHWLYYGQPMADAAVLKDTLIDMLAFGLIFGLGAGLVFGLLATLETPLDIASAATPTRLLASNRMTVGRQILVLAPALALTIGAGGQLVVDLLQPLFGPMAWGAGSALVYGVVGGVGGALAYALSFTAWGQWLVLCRVWLPLTGRLPWNTAAFLDDAYSRGVLRQTGAVYQFRHVRLQHHLDRSFREQQVHHEAAAFRTAPVEQTA
ncbi:helix-turn-helix domain-containing protein [Streptomyces sp. CY1]|uniref:helix-turn-helix domain-containing protein n=1 Tax=Streptomyces sp. CY1 TaxID=3388313 RepID=UPI0039A09B5A